MYRRIDLAGVFRASLLIGISSVMIFSTGCQKAEEELDYGRILPPGELALRKIVNHLVHYWLRWLLALLAGGFAYLNDLIALAE